MIDPRSIAVLAVLAAGCADAPHGLLSGIQSQPPPEIEEACGLATRRCAHCHPIERVMVSRGIGVEKWAMYVEQMRLKPSSGISVNEAAIIFRCLQFVEAAGRFTPAPGPPAHPLAGLVEPAPPKQGRS